MGLILKRFETPDETRELLKGKFELVHIGGMTIGRATYEPGWKWSEHVGPSHRPPDAEANPGFCRRSRATRILNSLDGLIPAQASAQLRSLAEHGNDYSTDDAIWDGGQEWVDDDEREFPQIRQPVLCRVEAEPGQEPDGGADL